MITITSPDLNIISLADDENEVLKQAREAVGLHLLSYRDDGEPYPEPTALREIKLEAGQQACLVDVNMKLVIFSDDMEAVNRTVTVPRALNEKAKAAGLNVSHVLQKALADLL